MSVSFAAETDSTIEWERQDRKTSLTSIFDDNMDETLITVPTGSGTIRRNGGWAKTLTLNPGTTVLNLQSLPVKVFGSTIYRLFFSISEIAVHNESIEQSIYIGNSGIANGFPYLGENLEVGPSGVLQYIAPQGIEIDNTIANLGLINNGTTIVVNVSFIGDVSIGSAEEGESGFSSGFSAGFN